MTMNVFNDTKISNTIFNPILIWCFLMPLIHFLSLISNILCIIVFCSKTFIHKTITIYFICLLISDSTTLLIGYSEMLDRESSMIDKSSLLCMFNGRIIHNLTDLIYKFMSKFCLEWILYKVLWTRASTILLAILSIQRSRTFFSLSYHESRLCASFACLISILIALLITCFEWIGIQCEKSTDSVVYWEIFQSIIKKKSSREFYSNYLSHHSIKKYSCLIQSFDIHNNLSQINQFNCSTTEISSEFYTLTQSLLSHRDAYISDTVTNILFNTYDNTIYSLAKNIGQVKSPDFVIKLFEKRSCQITLLYSICLKFYDFLYSISFGFNRHTLAIFFGNALPSFIVLLANLLSLKVIYFSESLKYLKEGTSKNRRYRRLQSDLRAFLVIIIESFSIITISWGIPIFLTMFHCQTLYVVSISSCPGIKKSLAIFLFTDLFNSSTNCLLYSLSGKLFRRKFISIIKIIFTCGRNILCNIKSHSSFSRSQQIELQPSNEPSAGILHCEIQSQHGSCRRSELLSLNQIKQLEKKKMLDDDDDNASLTMIKLSDKQETEIELLKKLQPTKKFQKPQTIKTFLNRKVSLFGSVKELKEKKTDQIRRRAKTNISCSSSSSSSSSPTSRGDRLHNRSGSQRQNQRYSAKVLLSNSDDSRSLTKQNLSENMTNL